MKPHLVLTCVFAVSLAREYNFQAPSLGLSSSIKLDKRRSLSSQHQQHGRSADQGEDDDNVNVQTFQGERKHPKDNPDGTRPAWSTQGNRQTCYYDMNATVIIKTNRSLTAGAKFVKYVQAENSIECARQCCNTPACNQAIFENKDDYSCYLFDCGEPNVCVFDRHKSYVSMSFSQQKKQQQHSFEDQPHQESKHENELADLDKQKPLSHASPSPPATTSTATTSTATTTTTTTTTTTPAPTTVSTTIAITTTKRKPKIASLNDECLSDDQCEDRHAECAQEKCTCQSGYYIKYGICRRQCDKHHFECDKNSLKEGLDCIELQHICDGIPQCADSSDEEGCSPDAFEDGPDSDIPYQVAASSSRDSIEEEMPNVVTKIKPSPPPHHTESSNLKLKQRGELAKAKYNVKSSIEKDNPDPPSETLEKTKDLAPADPLATKKSPNQQYPIQSPDIRNKETWVKKTRVQNYRHNGVADGTANNPSVRNDIDVQPSSRETSRIGSQSDSAGPVWHHLGSYPQYQKQGVVAGPGDRDVLHSSLQQQQQQRQHEEQLLQQQQQQRQQQPPSQGRVSNYGESDHRVPLIDPQVALSQPKIYGEDGQPLISKNYVLNGQKPNQQIQNRIYQPSSQNYIPNQYLQENGHMSPQQQQQQQPPPRKYGYHGNNNNYGYRQKVAAYRNGYALQQQQQPYQQVSGTYRDPSNGYAPSSGQAYNWGDYPADYLYTDQNADYPNIGTNAVQGYQYQPANPRNRPLSHNLDKGIHLSDDQMSDGTPKLRPTKSHGHYQATGNGPKGAAHQLPTGINPNVYVDQSPTLNDGVHKQPSTGLHTESKMHTADDQESQLPKTENAKAKPEHKEKSSAAGDVAQNGTAVTIDGQRGGTAAPTVSAAVSGMQNMTSPQTETGLAKFLHQSNYILKEKVVVASPTDNAQGPIVALALGLSFTTMLLIFVGCRLRRVKRRLRKGRALHSNEADYLINGMYL